MRKHALRLNVFSRKKKKRKLSWRRQKPSNSVLPLRKQRLSKNVSWPRKRPLQLKPLSRLLLNKSRFLNKRKRRRSLPCLLNKRKSRKPRSRPKKSRSCLRTK